MSWMYYLLEANLYLILFYALYYLALRRETWYQYNRAYLLGSSVLAFIIPVLQLGILKPIPENELPPQLIAAYSYVTTVKAAPIAQPGWNRDDILLAIYLLIVLCLLVSLAIKITRLVILSRKGAARDFGKWKIIKTDMERGAFSFFNYLFLSADMAASDTVITHELVHIRQKHSWDVIYLEIFKIINWFNPIAYLMQRSMKELHEFIADEAIAGSKEQVDTYTDFLVANAYGVYEHKLTNNLFNQSLLKKRIIMLYQKRSGNSARLKYLLALPLMGGLLCASTLAFAKDYGWLDIAPRKASPENSRTVKPEANQPTSATINLSPIKDGSKNKLNNGIPLLSRGSTGFIIDPSTYNFKTLSWMALKFQKKGYKMDFDEFKNNENDRMLKLSLRKNDSKPNSGTSATFKIDELIKLEHVIFIDADPAINLMHIQSHKFVLLIHQNISKKTDSTRKKTDSVIGRVNSTINGEINSAISKEREKAALVPGNQQSSNKLPPPAMASPVFGALAVHLAKYSRYPAKELEQRIVGNVIIAVTINNDHKIADVKVTNNARLVFADEVVRAAKLYTDTIYTNPGVYIIGVQYNLVGEKMTKSYLPADLAQIQKKSNFAAIVELEGFFKD